MQIVVDTMNSQLRMCRVCTAHEGDDELVPIFEKNNKVAIGIFLISGIKVCTVTSTTRMVFLNAFYTFS